MREGDKFGGYDGSMKAITARAGTRYLLGASRLMDLGGTQTPSRRSKSGAGRPDVDKLRRDLARVGDDLRVVISRERSQQAR